MFSMSLQYLTSCDGYLVYFVARKLGRLNVRNRGCAYTHTVLQTIQMLVVCGAACGCAPRVGYSPDLELTSVAIDICGK